MRRIVWAPLAVSRLTEAAEFIAEDDPGAAVRWAERAFDAVQRLAQFPRSGSVVAALNRDEIRELIHASHRIIYRIEPERIVVLTVRHARRLLDESEIE